ncbi:HAD family hydrolase [Trichothermofontia sp.]
MVLKAVLFDFNGVIINDESLHEQLIDQILLEENLRPKPGEFRQLCLGRSDRACLREILAQRGRVVSESYLDKLIQRKSQAYQQLIAGLERLPLYPGLDDLIFRLRSAQLKLAIVSGALRQEIEWVLRQANLLAPFPVIVAGDDYRASKPEPDGYLLAVARLNEYYPGLNLRPDECLAIEDTPAGIQAAKRAGIPVVGVAHTYPFHMLQRQANWTIDYLNDLELERVQAVGAS